MWRYLRLARPHFLLGGVLLFALGSRASPAIDAGRYLLGQMMVTAIQLTAQLANEFADAEMDVGVVNRTLFSGGSGMIQSGRIQPRAALIGARLATVLAVAAIGGMALVSRPAALAGVVALGLAWGYSTRPVRLLATGWGEPATSLVVAGLVPFVGAWSQGVGLTEDLWWAVAALIPLHLAMMICFELPDLGSDAAAGKRVLAARMGSRRAATLIGWCAAATGAILGLAAWIDGDASHRLVALGGGTLVAAVVAGAVRRRRWQVATTGAVAALVVVAAALGLGV